MDIIYVGTLPPHQGGSAISSFQLIKAMVRKGLGVRAIGPVTRDTSDFAERFAADHPEIEFDRFEVPYYKTSPDVPAPDDYWEVEKRALRACLQRMIRHRSPDLILLGRETFAWHLPDADINGAIPCVLRVAGGTMTGILRGNYSNKVMNRLLVQLRAVDMLIVPAQHLVKTMRERGCRMVTYIPNAIDVAQFSPGPKNRNLLRELRIEPSQIVVMHASNLKPIKRAGDFVRAAKQTIATFPGLVFVVAGDGLMRSEMEETCRELGMQDKFRFLGWVEYERMPEYIRVADIVVMCSEAEGLARVYLESQSCAKVLIASDIPAARQVITHGRDGLLFPVGDRSALEARILQAAGDADLRSELGRRARERVVVAHALDAAAEAYASTLHKVINLTRGHGGSTVG
ncbi:MAG: glycosyltransferase family 4 protein [Gammaproteobacteria bacterium]|nr:glycosyltransferase family 4 protein [Gammaproteobacteria bacterium]